MWRIILKKVYDGIIGLAIGDALKRLCAGDSYSVDEVFSLSSS